MRKPFMAIMLILSGSEALADPLSVWMAKSPEHVVVKQQGIADLIEVRDATLAVPETPHVCAVLFDGMIARRRAEMADLKVMAEAIKLPKAMRIRILNKVAPIELYKSMDAGTTEGIAEVLEICPPPPK